MSQIAVYAFGVVRNVPKVPQIAVCAFGVVCNVPKVSQIGVRTFRVVCNVPKVSQIGVCIFGDVRNVLKHSYLLAFSPHLTFLLILHMPRSVYHLHVHNMMLATPLREHATCLEVSIIYMCRTRPFEKAGRR